MVIRGWEAARAGLALHVGEAVRGGGGGRGAQRWEGVQAAREPALTPQQAQPRRRAGRKAGRSTTAPPTPHAGAGAHKDMRKRAVQSPVVAIAVAASSTKAQ